MKQFNRKPLFLGLALAAAAPFAFAQSTTPQTTQSTDTQSTETQSQSTQSSTTQPTQSQDAQSTTTQSTTDTQSTTATQSDTGASTTDAMASQSTTTGAQKRNWSDLDVDKNGSLSATEAQPISSLSQSFTTADANADGELTQDEYKAFLASDGKGKAPGSDK